MSYHGDGARTEERWPTGPTGLVGGARLKNPPTVESEDWDEPEPERWITPEQLKARHQALMLIILQWFGVLVLILLASASLIKGLSSVL